MGMRPYSTGSPPKIESKIAAAGLSRAAFVYRLGAMLRAGPFVFTRQEINLDLNCIAVHYNRAVIDERLARILFVAAPSK
jgi:hypothetical protein